MNLLSTTFLVVVGVGQTPEEASANFGQAFGQALAENPTLGERPYLSPPAVSPMLHLRTPEDEMGGYQVHCRVPYLKQAGDPENGWEYTVLPTQDGSERLS